MSKSSRRPSPKLWMLNYLREMRPSITHPILRSMLRIPSIPAGLTVELASAQEDLEQSYRLLHDVYVEMGFMEAHPSMLRLNVYNTLPHTSTVVAKINGQVVGTVSIIRENPLGLPLDESIDTGFYRKPGWQIAEVTALAVTRQWRGQGQVLFPLLKFVYEYAVNFLKVDVFQIATALDKEDFFRALLFFEPITEAVYRDPLINGTPVTPLYLDLNHAKAQFKRAYGTRGPAADLHTYFTSLELPTFKFPVKNLNQALHPMLTPELFEYFFKEKTNLLDRLSDSELHTLRSIYRSSPIFNLLKEPNSIPPYPPKRSSQRFVVSCPAFLESPEGDETVQLVDVSESGFRLFSKMPLHLSGNYGFRVQLSASQTVPILAKPVWNRRRREWGFAIIEAPKGWTEFLSHLENQLSGKAA